MIPTVIAVLGSNRSGSSCTAGVLHTLGVSMGERFQPPDKANPKGYFEALGLKRIVTQSIAPADRITRLRAWAEKRANGRAIIGAKHYYLCKQLNEAYAAWPGMKIIAINRPIEEVVRSQRKAGFRNWLTEEQLAARSQSYVDARDEAIERLKIPSLTVEFNELIANPAYTIGSMSQFIGIDVTPDLLQAAMDFINPDLKHFG